MNVCLITLLLTSNLQDHPTIPPVQTRLELTKRFIELSEYELALQILQGIMATDDQEVEAWYLEGWCFYLMADQAKQTKEKLHDLDWDSLARDARDCLESCRLVCRYSSLICTLTSVSNTSFIKIKVILTNSCWLTRAN